MAGAGAPWYDENTCFLRTRDWSWSKSFTPRSSTSQFTGAARAPDTRRALAPRKAIGLVLSTLHAAFVFTRVNCIHEPRTGEQVTPLNFPLLSLSLLHKSRFFSNLPPASVRPLSNSAKNCPRDLQNRHSSISSAHPSRCMFSVRVAVHLSMFTGDDKMSAVDRMRHSLLE